MTYLYACPACRSRREVEHSIRTDPVVLCERTLRSGAHCGARMKRVPQGGATVIFPMGTRKHEVR